MSQLLGYLVGFLVAFLIGFLIIMIHKKVSGMKGKCQYDERQLIERGKAYRAGFFTMLLYCFIYGMWDTITGIVWCDSIIGMFIGICLGAIVFATYCIWNDAYVAMNEKKSNVYILFGVVGLLNLLLGVKRIMDGEAITDGKLNGDCMNMICGLLFVVIFLAFAAKKWKNEREVDAS